MQVNIKGARYKIKLKKGLIDGNYEYRGVCYKDKKVIEISTEHETGFDLIKTYAHELAHAYMHELNLDTVISRDNEELICMMVESIVMHFVKNENE